MAILDLDGLFESTGPALENLFGLAWNITKLLFWVIGLGIIWWYTSFNVRILERKYTKGGRVSVKLIRAKKFFDKKLGHPQLKTFGVFGFKAKTFNEPPADCIMPFQAMFGNSILYDFVVKDGIHYPISNAVLGRTYIVDSELKLQEDDIFLSWARESGIEIKAIGNPENVIYSIQGSGFEITRDFEGEQATLNNLINAAERYKNRKPIEIAAMYGLMIIIVVGAFITLVYAFYKTGQISEAVNKGWELFGEFGGQITQQKLGPS